jgi:O-antigen ligase
MSSTSHRLLGGHRTAGNGAVIVLFAAAAFLALIGGLMAAVLPWWFILMLSVLPALALAGLLLPELAILGLLVLLCGMVPAGMSPQITLGPGVIKAHEVGLMLLFGLTLMRVARLPPLGAYWAWVTPVLLFLVLTVTGAMVGKVLYDAPMKLVLSEVRNQMFWLLVFVVTYLVQSESQLRRLTSGIMFVALLLSGFVIAQFVTGHSFIQDARVEGLVTLNQANSDIVRSTAGGGIYVIVFSILLLLARLMTRSISMPLALPILAALVAAVVVTFGRGIWIATMFVSLLMAFRLMRWKGVVNVLIAVTVGIAVAVTVLASFKPAIVGAALDRMVSTTQETLKRNTSLGWRAEEDRYAADHIVSSPLWGIGLGTPYKPLVRMNGMTVTESDEVLTRYIHNAYLGLWLKLGVVGFFAALWLSWATIRRGLLLLEHLTEPRMQSLTAASIGGFLVPVITSFTQPEWLTQTGIAFFALMLGVLICVHRLAPSLNPMSDQSGRTVRV